MRKIIALLTLIISLTMTATLCAENVNLDDILTSRRLNGTVVISSLNGQEYIGNGERAGQRLLPASTFKILNTLIALQERVVADEKEIIAWDGQDKGLEAWNKDQSIETAFPGSCIWFYQELAKRVGPERYLQHLKKTGYGNGQAGPEVTSFWLDGDLRISALEQVAFLKRLYLNELPYPGEYQDLVKRMMVVEKTDEYTIRAKTGWATRVKPQIGWYIGYVEKQDQTWFFAVNMDITESGQGRFRQEAAREALKRAGIL